MTIMVKGRGGTEAGGCLGLGKKSTWAEEERKKNPEKQLEPAAKFP